MYGRQKNKHGRQNNKQRLKSYAVQIKNAEATFAAEISKPVEDRDGDLLLECLETLEFFHERMDALVAQEHNNCPATPTFRSRFALIAAMLLIAALLVSCVAQTLGFRIWSVLIH